MCGVTGPDLDRLHTKFELCPMVVGVEGNLSYPLGMIEEMEATSLRFASAVRTLGHAARARGLVVPGFRSPPRLAGAQRTLRRHAGGAATVSVSIRERPFQAVAADMIEGIVVANQLDGTAATRARTALWEALVERGEQAA